MNKRPFAWIPVFDSPQKPWESGVTMLIDWGIGNVVQKDLLASAGDYVDLAKIAVVIAGLLSADMSREKLEIYRSFEVETFPWGQFLEYAVSHGCVDEYLEDAREVGFPVVEVSDNTAPFSAEFKRELTRKAAPITG